MQLTLLQKKSPTLSVWHHEDAKEKKTTELYLIWINLLKTQEADFLKLPFK